MNANEKITLIPSKINHYQLKRKRRSKYRQWGRVGDEGWQVKERQEKRRAGEEMHPGHHLWLSWILPTLSTQSKQWKSTYWAHIISHPKPYSNHQTTDKRHAKSPQKKTLSIKSVWRSNIVNKRPLEAKKQHKMGGKSPLPATQSSPMRTALLGIHLWLQTFFEKMWQNHFQHLFRKTSQHTRVAWSSRYYCYLFLVLTSSSSEKAFVLIRVSIWCTDRNVICMALQKKQKQILRNMHKYS